MTEQWQLCTIAPLQPENIDPVQNINMFCFGKPAGGLWTSTWLPEKQTSAWVEWCNNENTGCQNQRWTLLKPAHTARICEITSHSDLCVLLCDYQRVPTRDIERIAAQVGWIYLDYERLSLEFDAVHLTEAGQRQTTSSIPNLDGWSCESTLWFRWCFEGTQVISANLADQPSGTR